MKIFSHLALATLLLGVPAFAQHEHHEHDGHNHAENAAPRDESLVDFLWRKSDEAFHAGDYPRAIELHKSIVFADPTDVESYSIAAWLMWSSERADESNAHIERGLEANPQSAEMWDAAGQHYDLQKKFPLARDAFQKAVALAGTSADQMLRRRLAHAAEHAGDTALSIRTWQALVRDFPNEAVNKNNLARVEEAAKKTRPPLETASVTDTLGVALLFGLPMGFVWNARRS